VNPARSHLVGLDPIPEPGGVLTLEVNVRSVSFSSAWRDPLKKMSARLVHVMQLDVADAVPGHAGPHEPSGSGCYRMVSGT
jgi:hypothetical protein